MLIATLSAVIFANSPWQSLYFKIFHEPLVLSFLNFQGISSLEHLINELLMPFFFLLVTLEIKRELRIGALNTLQKAAMPVVGAIGGMLVPALIYMGINHHDSVAVRGWAIPTATDIAFSLSILMLMRKVIPEALKTFLTALAIIDDLGAIIIIVLFYSANLELSYLLLALMVFCLLCVLNFLKLSKFLLYGILGVLLWFFIAKSGIHSTIAGVLVGLTIPLKGKGTTKPLETLEQNLSSWVPFIILPLFALANTGLSFSKLTLNSFTHSITVGIFLGLLLGKQIGVFSSCWLTHKIGLTRLPKNVTFLHLYGVSILCGIGFTMSLFIGGLAFIGQNGAIKELVKLGVLMGSLASGLLGCLVLCCSRRVVAHAPDDAKINY